MLAHGYTEEDFYDIPNRRLSYRVLLAIVRQQEPCGRSALFRAKYPKSWGYNLTVQSVMELDSHMNGVGFEIPSDSDDDVAAKPPKLTSAEIRARIAATA